MIFGFKSVASSQPDGPEENNLTARLRHGLHRTQSTLLDGLGDLFLGKKKIDDASLGELEDRLLLADLGVDATTKIIAALSARLKRADKYNPAQLKETMGHIMYEILQPVCQPLIIPEPVRHKPFVILMVGVNGAGKTTSAGKYAKHLLDEGHSVMLAAGDTFRAAAVDQLKKWGERTRVPVIAQHSGADSAAVIYDALQAARSRQIDILIADTAGRLHTQENLMDELKKIRRTITKFDENIAVESMLIVDAGAGQNVLAQARQFSEAIGITGITLTKLDGTAKGGIIFALALALNIPIRFIGVGEQVDDLQAFVPEYFIDALLEIKA